MWAPQSFWVLAKFLGWRHMITLHMKEEFGFAFSWGDRDGRYRLRNE